jgi:hypothetical protein
MGNPEDELWLQELENPAIPFHKQEDEKEQPTAEKNESLYFQVNTSLANNQASGKDILKKRTSAAIQSSNIKEEPQSNTANGGSKCTTYSPREGAQTWPMSMQHNSASTAEPSMATPWKHST